MGSGTRKYYKRAIYIPKDHFIDASKATKEKEEKEKEDKKKPSMEEFLKSLKGEKTDA